MQGKNHTPSKLAGGGMTLLWQ